MFSFTISFHVEGHPSETHKGTWTSLRSIGQRKNHFLRLLHSVLSRSSIQAFAIDGHNWGSELLSKEEKCALLAMRSTPSVRTLRLSSIIYLNPGMLIGDQSARGDNLEKLMLYGRDLWINYSGRLVRDRTWSFAQGSATTLGTLEFGHIGAERATASSVADIRTPWRLRGLVALKHLKFSTGTFYPLWPSRNLILILKILNSPPPPANYNPWKLAWMFSLFSHIGVSVILISRAAG
ncbi:hypothetical protein NLJ89_g4406 [Agrocybe chaxingu]|uniref:Uncharacterized protein n=1 Tax=Agrocybe chaxingu TaxID=84603 RepID=A0A9W8K361_9AGAR|nr:hypothetical protein NLJ89_g4406 [Agrocybe chaxingu]